MANFDGGFSPETLASIPRNPIRSVSDLYPDRTATPSGTDFRGNPIFPVKDTGTVKRLDDQVPTTTQDMSRLYQWELGDTIYGDHAKHDKAMKNYIADITRADGAQEGYKHIFIDTFRPIGPQLERFKVKRKRRIVQD